MIAIYNNAYYEKIVGWCDKKEFNNKKNNFYNYYYIEKNTWIHIDRSRHKMGFRMDTETLIERIMGWNLSNWKDCMKLNDTPKDVIDEIDKQMKINQYKS